MRRARRQADLDRSAVRRASLKPEAELALGRSRGGFRTQILNLADQGGRPLCVPCGPGPAAQADAPLSCLMADRAWDDDAFRARRAQRDIKAVIPARSRRTNPQSRAPERFPARFPSTPRRGTGASVGSKGGAAWATRYDPYA